ncbi:MAG: hypothetical protein ACOZCO_08590 [Bacteroidota bacterium]
MKKTQYNRNHLLLKLSGNFSKDFERSIEGFTLEEQIHITEVLVEAAQRFEKDKDQNEHENIYNSTIDVLQKKYRKKLSPFMNCKLSDYLVQDSHKLLDLQYDEDIIDDEHQFMDDNEYKNYMQRVKSILYNYRSSLMMRSDAEGEEDKPLSGEKEKKLNSKESKVATARQSALFFYYLNEKLNINATKDKTALADVAAFLTGKNYDNLYKHMKKPFHHNEDQKSSVKELKQDLLIVKEQFERLGLAQMITIIDKEINSL